MNQPPETFWQPDWSKSPYPLYAHQKQGVMALLSNPAFALFDEVGVGKTAQVINAACALFERGQISALLIVSPASVRSVWADPDPVLGEVAKHIWESVPFRILEYSAKTKKGLPFPQKGTLDVIVTNYELLRQEPRLKQMAQAVEARGGKVLLVLDESWAIKNYKAAQTKAVTKLRWLCDRVVILNGTPGDPAEIYSQFSVLNPQIIGCRSFFAFRARYARMGGYMSKQIVGWERMDEFQSKIAPFALRRLKRECLDLPPVTYTQIDARLTPATWAHYTAMRDELVTWLSDNEVATAAQAGVRVMRLAQITAGFLGGVQEIDPQLYTDGLMPIQQSGVRQIGTEKIDALVEWLKVHWAGDKCLIFTVFRPSVEATASVLQSVYAPGITVVKLYGGQDPAERELVKRLLAPGGDPTPAIVVGNAAAGGAGLNFAASNLCCYLANDFSLKTRLQSEGRVDRPGQTRPVTYVDVIASGPNGEPTIDRTIVKALRRKQDLSDLTARAWREELMKEAA